MTRSAPSQLASDVRVRAVDPANIIDLIRIAVETDLSPWTHDDLLAEIKNPNAILLKLISDSNEVLGFVVGRLVPGEVAKLDAEVYNIAVTGLQEGRGLGQLLFKAFLAECRARSASNVWLEVRESNSRAVRFYEKNGFKHVQTRRDFYRDPLENALLMRLVLKNETP